MSVRTLAILAGVCLTGTAGAQTIPFDFDNAPIHSPLPVSVIAGGVQASLSATGQGYSIQAANTMGFTPSGFGGMCIYPSSIYQSDLNIGFSSTITGFSIMFAPQELECDDTARMRVTAYMNGTYVGTSTAFAPAPGTWPTGTLALNSPQGFNNVVVHYDARPPTCQDYGSIFLADNMTITVPSAAACPADFDGSGALSIQDIFAFLNAWFAGCP